MPEPSTRPPYVPTMFTLPTRPWSSVGTARKSAGRGTAGDRRVPRHATSAALGRARGPGLLRVRCFVPREHGDELRNLALAGRGALHGAETVDQGEAVALGEQVEHRLGCGFGGDRGGKVGGHLRLGLGGIGGLPPAVRLGGL